MKIGVTLCVSLFAFATASAQAQPAFKGLPLGVSEKEVVKKYPKLRCNGSSKGRMCHKDSNTGETIGDATVRSMYFQFYNDRLEAMSLTIWSRTFEQVAAALSDTYGKPTSDNAFIISNRMGAQVQNRRVSWEHTNWAITIKRYTNDLDTSSVHYMSREGAKRAVQKHDAEKKKAARDL